MSLPQKRTTVDDKAYELAKKLVSDVVSKLASKAISYTGASPAGGAIGKVYGEYAKQFFDLYLSVSRSEPYWADFRNLQRKIESHIESTGKIIDHTPPPEKQLLSVGFFLGALLAPKAASQHMAKHKELQQEIRKVVAEFDGMIRTFAKIDKYSADLIGRSQEMLENAPKRNNFDRVFTHGSIGSEMTRLCLVANSIVEAAGKLSDHRNKWADSIGMPLRRSGSSRAALRLVCEETL